MHLYFISHQNKPLKQLSKYFLLYIYFSCSTNATRFFVDMIKCFQFHVKFLQRNRALPEGPGAGPSSSSSSSGRDRALTIVRECCENIFEKLLNYDWVQKNSDFRIPKIIKYEFDKLYKAFLYILSNLWHICVSQCFGYALLWKIIKYAKN